MKKAVIKMFLFLMGLTLILSGSILVVVNNYKTNRAEKIEQEKQMLKKIDTQYKAFQVEVQKIPEKRENVYKQVDAMTAYYSVFSNHYNQTVKLFNEYEEQIVALEKNAQELTNSCVGKTYNREDTNQKCTVFIKNYEQVVNTFCNDIKAVNLLLQEYNQWIVDNKETSYKKLNLLQANTVKEYIDLNKDGIEEGNAD